MTVPKVTVKLVDGTTDVFTHVDGVWARTGLLVVQTTRDYVHYPLTAVLSWSTER